MKELPAGFPRLSGPMIPQALSVWLMCWLTFQLQFNCSVSHCESVLHSAAGELNMSSHS